MEQELYAAVARLEYERRRYLRPYCQTLGIPLGQGQPRILAYLLKAGTSSQKGLSDACGVDESTLSRCVDRLEDARLVVRAAAPGCRRSLEISLTQKGKDAAEKLSAAFRHEDDVLCAALGGRGREEALSLLDAMAEALRAAPPYDPVRSASEEAKPSSQ